MPGEGTDRSADLVRLGELGTFRRGSGGTKTDARTAGTPCVRYGDLYTSHDCVIRSFASFIDSTTAPNYSPLKRGDVVFAASGETHGEIGKAAVYCGREDAFAGADTVIFTPTTRLDPMFLGYAANTKDAERFKSRFGQGSSVIHISVQHLRDLPIFLPALPEQRRIAEILDTLDEVIRHTEQVIAKLQQMKQGLLHDLLTRGIDDNGELRDPVRHPEQFKHSPLGRIPKRWEVQSLGQNVDSYAGGTPPRSSSIFYSGSVPWVKSAEVNKDSIADTEEHITRQAISVSSVKWVPEGTPLMAMYGATAGSVSWLMVQATTNQAVLALVPLGGISARWLYWALINTSPRILASVQGSGQLNLSKRVVDATSLRFPFSTAEEHEISQRMDAVQATITNETSTVQKLRMLKHGLMDDLLAGYVRVKVPPEAA